MSKWTRHEQFLVFGIIIFGALAAALVVVVAVTFSNNDDKCKDERNALSITTDSSVTTSTCLSPVCVKTAAGLLDAIDQSIDPCEDFYEFACGKWNREHIIPEDKSGISRFNEIRDNVQAMLKGVLEKTDQKECQAVKNAKMLYRSCLNEAELVKTGRKEVDVMVRKLGGWPVTSTIWDENQFNLVERLVDLRLYSSKYIITVFVSPDDKNNSNHIIALDQALLQLGSRDYYLHGINDTHIKSYKMLAESVANKFASTHLEPDISDVIDFEMKLANLTTPKSQRRDKNRLYNKMTVQELQKQTGSKSKFDWKKYLNGVFNPFNSNITDDEEILVYEPEYFKNAINLVNNTPKRTIANYLILRFILHQLPYMAEEYRLLTKDYDQVMVGIKNPSARWKACIKATSHFLPTAVGRLFVDNFFDRKAKIEAVDLIRNVRASFSQIIEETKWMDKETKSRALDKENAIQERIAYPDWILNNDELDEYYQQVNIAKNGFFKNIVNIRTFDIKDSFNKLRKPVNKTQWYDGAFIVNAFYNPAWNSITFPAGILQPPFYHEDYPKSLIYGGIGMVIGHEITHGFDDQGRQFNKDGNLKSWWTNSSSEEFNNLAQCIIDQYSAFTIGQDHIKGANTQGENIADNGGIKAAYRAYKSWLQNNTEAYDGLPSLNFTHGQLFFLNFAQGWCGVQTPEYQHNKILADPHSPGRYRIIGTLSNSKDFSDEYQCKPGTKMNPEKKCRVW